MREHPIPQDLVGYRFHIIGNMTLKQFLEVGAGCIVAFLIYTTNLYPLFKWPLICIAVGFGAIMAFVPFEERPFDHWVTTFFKILYRPTKYYWRREPHIPEPFLYQPSGTTNNEQELDLSPARHQRIREYLRSVQTEVPLDPLDEAEQLRLNEIMASFGSVKVNEVDVERQAVKPNLRVRPRSMANDPNNLHVPLYTIDKKEEAPKSPYQYQAEVFDKKELASHLVAQDIQIPGVEEIDVDAESTEAGMTSTITTNDEAERAYVEDQAQQLQNRTSDQATLNTNLPFPTPPTEPNKLVGMVLSRNSDLLNDSIVEIQTESGSVARAVKTNALGQFFVTTPLADGNYTLIVEKDGFDFTPQQLQLVGEVVSPIEIRSLA
ncbi:MAG: PrgI family protein [bacterium]|nr:PrgI family protein [bacterium]